LRVQGQGGTNRNAMHLPRRHDLESIRRAAREAALAGWEAAARLRTPGMKVRHKATGPVTDADVAADRAILRCLAARFDPAEVAFLTEETADDPIRHQRRFLWIIDPIDGTVEFIRGDDDFAVHAGFAASEEPGGPAVPIAAAVYEPAHGRLYTAALGQGTTVEERLADGSFAPPRPVHTEPTAHLTGCVGVISPRHRSRQMAALAAQLPLRHWVKRGSMGVKICEVADARADLFVLPVTGYLMQWDVCAPQLILTEAGGRITDAQGRPITFNHREPEVPGIIVATNGACHEALLELIASVPEVAG
jgi:3'(2'), 5'-bisphosphate nucleotidase